MRVFIRNKDIFTAGIIMVFKRSFTVLIFLVEISAIIVLCVLLYRHIYKSRTSRYIIHLQQDHYHPVLKSLRFPHYFEPKPNELINDHPAWLGYNVSYSINADSLNERSEYSIQRSPNTYRIVTLGDSFTYGLLVNTYENYSERLEDMLNADTCDSAGLYEVINLGVPAYDVGYAAERYELRGRKYDPDLLIWFMNPFTMDIDADRKIDLENAYLKKIPFEKHWQTLNGKIEYYPGYLAWAQYMQEEKPNERVAKQRGYLQDFLASYRGKLLIVINNWSVWSPVAKQALLESVLYKENIQLQYLDPQLRPSIELLADGHPSVKGHERIASDIRTYLMDHGLLPCWQPAP